MDPFELRDGDLRLTSPTDADVDRIAELCQDPQVQEWTTVPAPYTRDDAAAFVGRFVPASWDRGSPTWGIRVPRGDGWALVGMVGLDGVEAASAEVGYWLGPQARGRGIMGRALGLALDAGFGRLGLERVEWRAFVGNWPSWRVAWQHGFHKEGQVRGLGLQRGHRRDEWIGTLLRTDPRRPATTWDGPGTGTGGDGDDGHDGREVHDGRDGIEVRNESKGPDGREVYDGRDPEALVREFHATYGLPVVAGADVDRDRVHMRTALVAEELAELVAAVYGPAAGHELTAAYVRAVAADDGARDTVAAADALGDLVYVIYGMALECGIPLPAVLAQIHASNLSKLGADGRPLLRQDGKVLKGPGYFPPDVAGVLGRRASGEGSAAQ